MSAVVPLRLVCSFLLLIFFVIAVWLLIAHDFHQGGDIFLDESNEVSTGEVFGHDQNVAAATAVRGNPRARGRKMAAGKLVNLEILPMAQTTTVKQNRFAASEKSASTKIMMSKQQYFSRNGSTAEEIKGEKREFGRSLLGDQERSLGFVAFNADYHGPRHHPPKNN